MEVIILSDNSWHLCLAFLGEVDMHEQKFCLDERVAHIKLNVPPKPQRLVKYEVR